VQDATRQLQQDLQAQSEKAQATMRAQAAKRRLDEERRAALEIERRQEVAMQTQAAADQARAEQAASTAKSEAWHRFYKPPKKCESPPDWDTQVECGNAHIRAHREFEAKWARGELR
jgi:multidrug efflux pump subunit AcrA (membrane-fusion protein)